MTIKAKSRFFVAAGLLVAPLLQHGVGRGCRRREEKDIQAKGAANRASLRGYLHP